MSEIIWSKLSVPNKLVMFFANVAWYKGMNEAPLLHIQFGNMGCIFVFSSKMWSTLTSGYANRRHQRNVCVSYNIHADRLPGPSVHSLHSYCRGFGSRCIFFSSHLFSAGTRFWTVVLGSLHCIASILGLKLCIVSRSLFRLRVRINMKDNIRSGTNINTCLC